jgi:hypothetical protein
MVLVEKLTVAQLVMKFVFTEPEVSHSDRDSAVMIETVRNSETSVYSNETTSQKAIIFVNRCLTRILNVRRPEIISNEELWGMTQDKSTDTQIKDRKW